ncbi:cytochrome c oxidase assembly protein [Maricaulis sp.]|uniref:cytochrome c oxidase assembly protein n=1 Tax=Maricaulis sp. TaxID=1486257 RepID=UPI003A8F5233
MKRLQDKNARTALFAGIAAVTMVGAAFASVPLYSLFCQVTGYGGTTRVAVGEAGAVLDREVTILFDANTSRDIPWEFQPVQRSLTLNVGESGLAYYRATNTSSRRVTGVATYNVAPYKAASYFSKIECFCFTEQTLEPGESIDMPVLFFVDPLIAEEPYLDDVHAITLSYTFFETDEAASSPSDAAP